MMHRIEKTFAGRKLSIETGRMAKQAAGSALVQFGETMVLAAVTVSDTKSPLDFFPLLVEYLLNVLHQVVITTALPTFQKNF